MRSAPLPPRTPAPSGNVSIHSVEAGSTCQALFADERLPGSWTRRAGTRCGQVHAYDLRQLTGRICMHTHESARVIYTDNAYACMHTVGKRVRVSYALMMLYACWSHICMCNSEARYRVCIERKRSSWNTFTAGAYTNSSKAPVYLFIPKQIKTPPRPRITHCYRRDTPCSPGESMIIFVTPPPHPMMGENTSP